MVYIKNKLSYGIDQKVYYNITMTFLPRPMLTRPMYCKGFLCLRLYMWTVEGFVIWRLWRAMRESLFDVL
jgi:hypothetical protein